MGVAKVDNEFPEAFDISDDTDREELIRTFLPLVKRVVHRLAGRLPAEIDIKEMLNSGIIGLVDALEKYDPRHETNFATYAQFRIRGAILDSFRTQDWVPRSLRHKAHRLEEAYMRLEQKLGRAAEDLEVAEEMEVELEDFRRMLTDVGSIVMLSFEELGYGHGEERFVAHDWMPGVSENPLEEFLESERVEIIARALDRLSDKERLVITLYFYEELNLKEIGEIIGVTESRASQIRSRALLRLRAYLRRAF
ncbi:MAG: FliA/WhiG family RNA polymerase sigma factor [bacterium]|nr:FliA/WhiG family RNA polymerase sigma factor [bacterium]